jgi:hypothetical protein
MRIVTTLLTGMALWGSGTAALACSVNGEFVRSSSYELVERADAVVVAVADSQSAGSEEWDTRVTFRIERALKGDPPATVLRSARLGRTTRSDPNDLTTAHPETFEGGCSRSTFERGGRYVLFLREGEGVREPLGWYAMDPTFGRGAEDYAGPDSLWVRALSLYIDIQQREPDRMAALDALANRLSLLEVAEATAADRQLAGDIRDHLSSLSPDKPTAYLVNAYEALERGESPRFSVRGPEANREGGMADAMTDLVFDIRRPDFDIERQKASILVSLVNGEHPDALALFERLLAGGPDSSTLGLIVRYLSNNGQYRRAFEIVETEVMRRLGGLADEEAFALVGDVAVAMQGPGYLYDQNNEAWRSEPYVRARWPETALSLFWDMKRRGWDGGFAAEVAHLRPSEYRMRPEVTMALAKQFDEAVEAWAIEELQTRTPSANWLEDEDPAWLPLRTLVWSYGEERDAALVRFYCSGESGRIMTVQTLGLWGDEMDSELLQQMLLTTGQDEEAVDGVRKALSILHGRHATDRDGLFGFRGASDAYEAVKASLTGEPVERFDQPLRPVICPAA